MLFTRSSMENCKWAPIGYTALWLNIFVRESRKVSRLPFKAQGVLNCFNIILTTLNAVKFLDMKADL